MRKVIREGKVGGWEVGEGGQLEYKKPRGSWEKRVRKRTKERGGRQRTI